MLKNIAAQFNERGYTPREVFMNNVYDSSKRDNELNKEIEYITTQTFYQVIKDGF